MGVNMKSKLRLVRLFIGAGGMLLALSPGMASAHDALGGDELVVANWMLIGAMVTIMIGLIAALWGFKSGQFTNIEESKYSMIDTSEDFDAIMAEADAREAAIEDALRAAEKQATEGKSLKSEAAVSQTTAAAQRTT